jgi:hypothetical protein
MAVLISGFDPAGAGRGGLFYWDGNHMTCLDTRDTTGLRMHKGNLLRCLWTADSDCTYIVKVGPGGHSSAMRLDGVGDPHDVLRDGELTVVVATQQNRVVWFRPDGTPARVWQPGTEPDSWHLNSLTRHNGRLLVSAFGQFSRRKEWELLGRPASGCVLDLESGQLIIDGLSAPHTPRWVDGHWLVCNSATGELLAVDRGRERRTLATLAGWARGLAVSESLYLVGVSPPRHAEESLGALSRVALVSRALGGVIAEVEVPAREIYDLVLVRRDILPALRGASDRLAVTAVRHGGTVPVNV